VTALPRAIGRAHPATTDARRIAVERARICFVPVRVCLERSRSQGRARIGMERIRYFAEMSVARGSGFAALAIAVVMTGLSYDVLQAVRCGAILTTMAGAVLVLKAVQARARDYRRSELWILLDKRHGLPEDRARTVISGVLQETFLRYAQFFGFAAGVLWTLTLVLSLAV
jgi:hypothetical protein